MCVRCGKAEQTGGRARRQAKRQPKWPPRVFPSQRRGASVESHVKRSGRAPSWGADLPRRRDRGRADLHRLADVVDERLRKLTAPGRVISPQSLLLAALSLAHDLEDERTRRVRSEQRAREMLSGLLARIDAALEADSAELAAIPPHRRYDQPRRVGG